ncbi:regulator of G-protein signaling 7-like isoform X2 [Antedon mediterranea]|uniref:regulator of G-protein signaling 7-like isoform X2 n=1 Tax=Antedon mediterranea TaxID=105859 RepID=UPI003AF81A1D
MKMAHWRKTNGANDQCNPNAIVYHKIEKLIQRMQDDRDGVPVKTVRSFMSKVPSVFTGGDLVQWLMKNLEIDPVNAIHLGSLVAAHGYFFPITDHVLTLKDDNTFYRFQAPYFWPSNCWEPENTDYAVYLCKRTMQNKSRLELADYEAENLAKLQRMFSRKWEFIFMQAEVQAKVDKKRDKMERKVLDSQERAFWDVHRPVPGCVNTTEMDIKKVSRMNRSSSKKCYAVTDMTVHEEEIQKQSCSDLHFACCSPMALYTKKVDMLKARLEKRQYKTSKVAELLVSYCQQYREYDGLITTMEAPNPWISDETALWDAMKTKSLKDVPAWRVKKWTFGIDELLRDPLGREQFAKFLETEFSGENLRFWIASQELKASPMKMMQQKTRQIWEDFLSADAPCPINIDSRVMDETRKHMETAGRYAFDAAEDHIHELMKTDSYPRFLKSEQYKELLSPKKKVSSHWDKTKSLIPKLSTLASRSDVDK